MTAQEFKDKYRVPNTIIESLDWLYLNLTREQALEIINVYFDNADEIWNSLNRI